MGPDIPLNHIAPGVPGAPKGQFVTVSQQGDPDLVEEQYCQDTQKRSLLIWRSLSPGDVVSLRELGTQEYAGTVESNDGLIIWVGDDLNERRLFHFHECQSVRVIR